MKPRTAPNLVAALLLGLGFLLGSCTQAPPSTGGPGLDLRLNASALEVEAGGTARITVTLTPRGGAVGRVSLTLYGAPAGVSLSPQSLEVGTSPVSAELTVTAGASTPVGTYPVRLRAASAGAPAETGFVLTVRQAPAGFSLSLSPGSLTVQQGGTGTVQLTLTSQGFSGQVNLSVSGAPQGVQVSFPQNPWSIAGSGQHTQTLTVNAGSSAAPGTYTLTLTATSGSLTRTATLTLQVVSSTSPAPDFSLSLSPASLTVQQGGTGTTTLTLTPQNGFSGQVNLSVSGAPQGVQVSFPQNPWSITGSGSSSQTLTVSASASAPTGTHTLTLTATSGSLTRTVNLTLTLTSGNPPSFTLSLSPTSLTEKAGTDLTLTLTLTPQNGFSGEVALSLVNPPPGVSLSPSTIQVSGGPVTQTVTLTTASLAPDRYSLTLKAQGGGVERQATLQATLYRLTIQRVEIGQTLLLPMWEAGEYYDILERFFFPMLGKPVLLRVHLTSTPAGVSLSNPLTGKLEFYTTETMPPQRLVWQRSVSFTCPGSLPGSTDPTDLSTTCNAILNQSFFPAGFFSNPSYGEPGAEKEMRLKLRTADGQERNYWSRFYPPVGLKVVVVPIITTSPSSPHYGYDPPVREVAQALPTLLPQLLPVAQVQVRIRDPYYIEDIDNVSGLGVRLSYVREQDGATDSLYLGIYGNGSGGAGGGYVAVVGIPVGEPIRYPEGSANGIIHEVGHAFGALHAPPNTPDPDPYFPYPDGRIGVYGWDHVANRIIPNTAYDVMGYILTEAENVYGRWWISDYTYFKVTDPQFGILSLAYMAPH